MADQPCLPKPLAAAINAKAKLEGFDFTSDAAAAKGMDILEKTTYERVMAKELEKAEKPYTLLGKKQPTLKKNFEGEKLGNYSYVGSAATWSRASDFFGDRFYNGISKRIRDVQKRAVELEGELLKEGKEAPRAMALYRKSVVPYLNAVEDEIIKAGTKFEGAALDAELTKRFGIDSKKIYEALDYVRWLKKGDFYGGGPLARIASTSSRSMASMNFGWTIFNTADSMRIISRYSTKPTVMVQGVMDALRATKEGIDPNALSGGDLPRSVLERVDPFSITNRINDRLAYFLDKADGGDGITGMRKNAFNYDNWDVTGFERHNQIGSAGRPLIMGLGRFLLAETTWNMKNLYNIGKLVARKGGNFDEAANYVIYTALKGIAFGPKALFPAFMWNEMVKQEWVDDERQGVVNDALTAAAQAMGVDASIDLGESLQPFGIIFGARLSQLSKAPAAAGRAGSKALSALFEGDVPDAALNTAIFGLSIMNIMGVPQGIKVNEKVYKTADWVLAEQNFVNNATVVKMLKTIEESGEEGWSPNKFWIEAYKDIFGAHNVKEDR